MEKIKFLIIRFSSIGDIVLTTPVIRTLKQQVKNAEIHYVTKKAYFDVVKHNPYIDKIHLFDADFTQLLNDLKEENLDYIIDLHHNLRSSRLKNKLKIAALSFNKINWQKFVMVNFKKNILPPIHIVDRYMQTLSVFEVENDDKGLDYFLGKEDEINLEDWNLEMDNYIAFAIGATHSTKRLPNEKIISILKQAKGKIVLLGGPTDSENAEIICKEANNKNIINTCGKLKLNQSAYMVKHAHKVLTHDTGMMHIAAAYKKEIISVWGNTIPEFGMTPYLADKNSEIVEVKNLKCRPCTKIGFSSCPKKHFKCMNQIDENRILQLINE